MILAAGRGERMRPLTDRLPKPMLEVGGKPLIVWHIEGLIAAGIRELVINHAHLGHKMVEALGDGSELGARIAWSAEPAGALETAGGIAHARHLLGDTPFVVVNGDIWCNADFAALAQAASALHAEGDLAHLLLVPNPAHNPGGDFVVRGTRVFDDSTDRLTFSGIGAYHPSLFDGLDPDTPAKLAPLLRAAMREGRVSGALHRGHWYDVGTPQRLAEVDALAGAGH
ncbi:N-acetylmuramate alpha-1-phosphate uridylyltransferase MurU [Methyloversatilis sp.]|uniref:N-acetylmuramate alpha-1-phosphate uridylyltransferase MurU n=1 Tax=Methyloversatilis sp. TaxID=2569862 RepID=UPI0035B006BC